MERGVAPAALAWLAGSVIAGCATGQEPATGDAGLPRLTGDGAIFCGDQRCRQIDCASKQLPDTTLRGTVYDPAGVLPLYNVFVYVPNGKPDPIVPGHSACELCQASASGSPLVWSLSDSHGGFRLSHVPAGDDVPLVLQLGKWRRQIVVPHVEACQDNVLEDHDLVRLPAKGSEGDMPLMALTTGCDATECFLLNVGIDPSEFTGPAGSGHVHVYGGNYPGMTLPGMGDAYALWSSPEKMAAYDLVLASCECAEYQRDTQGPAYEAMRDYLDSGGRLYATHYQFNWFAQPTGPIDFQHVADWLDDYSPLGFTSFFVDSSFPKGQALAEWLQSNDFTATLGQVPLTDTRDSVARVTGATRWIYGAEQAGALAYAAKYLSFNTPVGVQSAKQCGRATFSDVHVAGLSLEPGPFPQECAAMYDPHGVNERALEFLFFDLASCIQDDSQNPSLPQTK
jgi:hypothetical protein